MARDSSGLASIDDDEKVSLFNTFTPVLVKRKFLSTSAVTGKQP
jgi:hypothetical protein